MGYWRTEQFDRFAKMIRGKGWNNVDSFLKAGITRGNVLEIGPGPGYVGLEWLKQAPDSTLTGCEISRDMYSRMVRFMNGKIQSVCLMKLTGF